MDDPVNLGCLLAAFSGLFMSLILFATCLKVWLFVRRIESKEAKE